MTRHKTSPNDGIKAPSDPIDRHQREHPSEKWAHFSDKNALKTNTSAHFRDSKVIETALSAISSSAKAPKRGLSAKLLALTIAFIMVSEVLIYVPSIANFRQTWLEDLHSRARVAAVILLSDAAVQDDLTTSLASETGALVIVAATPDRKRLLLLAEMPPMVDKSIALGSRSALELIYDAFEGLLFGRDRVLRIRGPGPGDLMDVQLVIYERQLHQAMLDYSVNILLLSVLISVITASLVFVALRHLFIHPLTRIVGWMAAFASDPANGDNIIKPTRRRDEIGSTEQGLAAMQHQVLHTLQSQRRLADLGLAVSKINHDLRNILASAQLFSDRLADLPDPTVKRLAPKLVSTLDRAITYTEDVLAFGRAAEALPERRLLSLAAIADEVCSMLGLDADSDVALINEINPDLEIDADPGQLFRVVMNLCRNAHQILSADPSPAAIRRIRLSGWRLGSKVIVRVADTGPGLAARARQNLFKPFESTARSGGTGLGLAISAEIIRAHGGEITLVDEGPDTIFQFIIPDRGELNQPAKDQSAGSDDKPATLAAQ